MAPGSYVKPLAKMGADNRRQEIELRSQLPKQLNSVQLKRRTNGHVNGSRRYKLAQMGGNADQFSAAIDEFSSQS